MTEPTERLWGEHLPVVAPWALCLLGVASSLGAGLRLDAERNTLPRSEKTASTPAAEQPPAATAVAPTAPAERGVPAVVAALPPPGTQAPATPPPTAAPNAPLGDCVPLFEVEFPAGAVTTRLPADAVSRLAEFLRGHPGVSLAIDGHADARGSRAGNLNLSHMRASHVAATLQAAGAPRERLTVRAFGAYVPVVGPEATDARNRRVDITPIGAVACPADPPR